MRYTEQEILEILRQLQTIKRKNGGPVFLAWLNSDETSAYHTILLDTGVGIQTLEFQKAYENKPEQEG